MQQSRQGSNWRPNMRQKYTSSLTHCTTPAPSQVYESVNWHLSEKIQIRGWLKYILFDQEYLLTNPFILSSTGIEMNEILLRK